MFAPKIAKPQQKAAVHSTSNLLPYPRLLLDQRLCHDPVRRALFLQRTIGNQATLKLLAQRGQSLPRNARKSEVEQEVVGEDISVEPAPCGILGDFSNIPLIPPGGARQAQPFPRPAVTPIGGAIQAKLVVGQANDPLEQEADRVAEHLMRMPDPEHSRASGPARVDHKCASCKGQRKGLGRAETIPEEAPPVVQEVLRSPGQQLDPASQAFFEPRFGYDLSDVRVHADARAAESARAVGAHAYAVGPDVVFGKGQYTPGTQEGRQLLAHELAHTLQQTGGAPAKVARQPMDPRHARGFGGEHGMGFIHYQQEDGWIFFEGPSGSSGHGVTESGYDGVAYNVRTGEIHLVDNKSLARQGNVGSATAIDPSRNLGKNLDALIERVESAKDVPGRVRLLGRLRALKTSLAAGQPLPKDVKLVVTGVGGQSTGVTGRLQSPRRRVPARARAKEWTRHHNGCPKAANARSRTLDRSAAREGARSTKSCSGSRPCRRRHASSRCGFTGAPDFRLEGGFEGRWQSIGRGAYLCRTGIPCAPPAR